MNRLRPHGASQPRNGPCCATVGPGSLARRRLGVFSAKAAVTLAGQAGIEARSRKARRGSAGRARKEVFDVSC